MSRKGNGEDTYATVRDRFQQWRADNPAPASRSAIRIPELPDHVARLLAIAVGFGVGALLLLLAVTAFVASGSWGEVARSGAATAYALTGFFLTVAGLGAILATYNHVFRVLARPGGHH